ncbi:thioredoxin family protein [Marinobacterium aestuarii]|uniref:Thioredoxin family protein n=1 Tax=Marinobacterium aestuarii TaxID=1821621 RepID=A0A1A9EY71_9GAMM|nr:TlpA disulfide reductase family protein [Marinobacterium aestuarii]ANG62690.1 thioredoxin family protein [Marinobacterium aestuarii]
MKSILLGLALAAEIAISSLTPASAAESVYELSFADLQRNPAPLEQYHGKLLLLNFWATWCPPCIREMPSMTRLQQHFDSTDLAVVAVNVGESPEAIANFRQQLDTPLAFEILLDESGSAFQELGIPGLPMSYLYDREGTLLETVTGGHEWDSPERIAQIKAWLKP